MAENRPDPDELLSHVRAEEVRSRRGRLRIFFGANAGVGKTYAMLEAARGRRSAGADVVIGYVEPHGRFDTERLMEGLERLPTLAARYRGVTRQEFDLDAALARRPSIVLVDELAHSNLVGAEPAPRHPKRWQDVEELLAAGIDVWTTINVQHLESLNDVVAQITGARQRETVPDRIFDEADEVELIDLPAEDLLARLRAGKIYLPDDATAATERFFRKGNLLALRELALRRTTDRVQAASRASQRGDSSARGWLARDRILVATGPDPQSEQTIRAGKRLADALDAEWTVVYVETPALRRLTERERDRRVELLRLAESLGAETVTIDGPSAADALLEYAQTRQVTRVIVGAPKRSGWRAWLRPSTATELALRARGFDVVTIAAADRAESGIRAGPVPEREWARQPFRWRRYLAAFAATLACTALAAAMFPYLELTNLVMIYLLGVAASGLWLGRGPSVFSAVLNVAAFDFFFVPPQFTFAVTDVEYLLTFGVMLIIGLVIATLMASVRQQTRVAGARERRTALLYAMSRELAGARGTAQMAAIAIRHVAEVFDCEAAVLLPDPGGRLRPAEDVAAPHVYAGSDLAVAQWVIDHGRRAGLGTDTLPAAVALYLPLGDEQRRLGVIAVLPRNRRRVLLPEQLHLLETFAGQLGIALERARLAEQAEATRLSAQSETLRNTLLASISHDLRTPLAVMAGAASTLQEHGADLDRATSTGLAQSIETKAREMSELISNVLDLMRFESGKPALRLEWETLDDLVAVAQQRAEPRLDGRVIDTQLPAELPAAFVDASLIVQVLTNLLENFIKYTPRGTRARISAVPDGDFLRVTIEDDGPGLPGDASRLFDKFQRGSEEGAIAGVGLGLSICRAILRAHGGDISAGSSPSGGARFEFTLPTKAPAA